jgi:hypothetical protein
MIIEDDKSVTSDMSEKVNEVIEEKVLVALS